MILILSDTFLLKVKMFTPFSVIGCSLELLKTGEQGIITFCKSHNEIILNKLKFMGITPGNTITVEQHFPLLVIKIENRFLTLEMESIRAIYVRITQN